MVASVGDSRAGRVAYVPLTSAHLHYRTAGDKAAACCWTSWPIPAPARGSWN